MSLRGKKPKNEKPRLKMLLSGPAGVGKTTAACKMPRPYIIDGENGTQHYAELIEETGGVVFQPVHMDDVITEVRALMTEDHDFLTLIIDPITMLYHQLGDEGERKIGSEFSKNYKQYADKFVRRLLALLTAIDMNVIVTAHEKNQWGKDADGKPTITGVTFDGYVKLDYIFDLYMQLERDQDSRKRYANVVKTRLPKNFEDGDRFEWSYEELARRMGVDNLERQHDVTALANPAQVEQFNFLLSKLSEAERDRLGIKKALRGVENIADMPADRVQKGIDMMLQHVTPKGE